MLVTTRHSQEISWPYALLPVIVFIQISALNSDYPHIISMRVQASIIAGIEFGKFFVSALVRVTSEHGHRHSFRRPRLELRAAGRNIGNPLVSARLTAGRFLRPHDAPRRQDY